jgi:hypothetical protein
MRADDLSGGSIKALLLILALALANLTALQFRHPERSAKQSKDRAEATFKLPPPDPSTPLGMTGFNPEK